MTIKDGGVQPKSEDLGGKRIALGVCGGIGAVEIVKISRDLRRHGAHVTVYTTPSVQDFISPLSLGWGAGTPVVEKLGPEADHLEDFDLVLVVPATWNTLAKMAAGIADNPVTLLVASQLGARRRVGVIPTMNDKLAAHPLFPSILATLKEWGVRVFEGPSEEGRRKVPSRETVTDFVKELMRTES